MKKKWI